MKEKQEVTIDEIIKLIPSILFPKNKPISVKLKLENDLGIYGDDAVDFITKFAKKYNVDISDLDFSKYFTKEISFYFVRKFFIKSDKKDLTIEDLLSSIKTGKLE
jgi:acyl carrier protein